MTSRMEATENPYIEDVLDKYASLPDLTMMALGSSYWGPPTDSLLRVANDLGVREVHRYGNILGDTALKEEIRENLNVKGFNTTDLDMMITPGANQGFTNIALALCDPGDTAGGWHE